MKTNDQDKAVPPEKMEERCEHCPFRTKKYASPEECGNCPHHQQGCREYNEYLQALMLASTIV